MALVAGRGHRRAGKRTEEPTQQSFLKQTLKGFIQHKIKRIKPMCYSIEILI